MKQIVCGVLFVMTVIILSLTSNLADAAVGKRIRNMACPSVSGSRIRVCTNFPNPPGPLRGEVTCTRSGCFDVRVKCNRDVRCRVTVQVGIVVKFPTDGYVLAMLAKARSIKIPHGQTRSVRLKLTPLGKEILAANRGESVDSVVRIIDEFTGNNTNHFVTLNLR